MAGEAGLLVISAHLDDAVLSCASQLVHHPGSTVCTVFAGTPSSGEPADEWDASCGFRSAGEAVRARRAEDLEALGRLGATQLLLEGHDPTPRLLEGRRGLDRAEVVQIAGELGSLFDRMEPARCLVPLGLSHPDHLMTRAAALQALQSRPWCEPFVYVDLPYGLAQRGAVELQLRWVGASRSVRFGAAEDLEPKRFALEAYESQVGRLRDVFAEAWDGTLDPRNEQVRAIEQRALGLKRPSRIRSSG